MKKKKIAWRKLVSGVLDLFLIWGGIGCAALAGNRVQKHGYDHTAGAMFCIVLVLWGVLLFSIWREFRVHRNGK